MVSRLEQLIRGMDVGVPASAAAAPQSPRMPNAMGPGISRGPAAPAAMTAPAAPRAAPFSPGGMSLNALMEAAQLQQRTQGGLTDASTNVPVTTPAASFEPRVPTGVQPAPTGQGFNAGTSARPMSRGMPTAAPAVPAPMSAPAAETSPTSRPASRQGSAGTNRAAGRTPGVANPGVQAGVARANAPAPKRREDVRRMGPGGRNPALQQPTTQGTPLQGAAGADLLPTGAQQPAARPATAPQNTGTPLQGLPGMDLLPSQEQPQWMTRFNVRENRGPAMLTGFQAEALAPIMGSMLNSSAAATAQNQQPSIGDQIRSMLAQEELAGMQAAMEAAETPEEAARIREATRQNLMETIYGPPAAADPMQQWIAMQLMQGAGQ